MRCPPGKNGKTTVYIIVIRTAYSNPLETGGVRCSGYGTTVISGGGVYDIMYPVRGSECVYSVIYSMICVCVTFF